MATPLRRPARQSGCHQTAAGHADASGEWISILTAAGLVIDTLHELYAPAGATDHPYYQIATASWSWQWPVEEIWIARRPAA